VRGLTRDSKRRAVVESVVALAETLESAVVAEGPSSEEELTALTELGVDLVQANILCPAMPLEELQRIGYLTSSQIFHAPLSLALDEQGPRVPDQHRVRLSRAMSHSFYT